MDVFLEEIWEIVVANWSDDKWFNQIDIRSRN